MATHTAARSPGLAWPGIRLNLTGALLLDFSLSQCQLDDPDFTHAQFTDLTYFMGTQLTNLTYFEGARVTSAAEPGTVWPLGWITRSAQPDNGEDPAFLYLARVDEPPDA